MSDSRNHLWEDDRHSTIVGAPRADGPQQYRRWSIHSAGYQKGAISSRLIRQGNNLMHFIPLQPTQRTNRAKFPIVRSALALLGVLIALNLWVGRFSAPLQARTSALPGNVPSSPQEFGHFALPSTRHFQNSGENFRIPSPGAFHKLSLIHI